VALSLGAAACNNNTPAQMPDMSTPPSPDMTTTSTSTALLAVAGSDLTNGALATIGVGNHAVTKNVDMIDPYSVVRGFGHMLYALDQTNGLVRSYDATQNFQNPVEFPAGKAIMVKGIDADPHDIYIDAPRQIAYISLFGTPGSTAVTAARALGVIDLNNVQAGISRFVALSTAAADTDGNPEADKLAACNNTLYVVLLDQDRNNSFAPTGPGRLAVVSLTGSAVTNYIQLAGRNPSGITILPGCTEAIVGSSADQAGGVQAGLGGIERVDLVNGKSLGLIVKDTDLGGNVAALDAVDAAHVFAAVSIKAGTGYSNTVYPVDLTTKQKGAAILGPMSFVPSVQVLGGNLVVLSSGTAGAGQRPVGVYIGAATGAPLTGAALDVGLPPQSVTLVTP
jgi:hypothetical protein